MQEQNFLTKKRELKIIFDFLSVFLLTIGSLLILYLIWELYWINKYGYEAIRWHTKAMVYVYIWYFGFIIFWGLKSISKEFILLFTSVTFSLFLLEIFLNITEINSTYNEKKGIPYQSPYKVQVKGHYHKWKPNETHYLKTPEYSYWRPSNSLGFPDEEWDLVKPNSQIRILALGDSFTEGDGAPFDSSYVEVLKTFYSKHDTNLYFMNAGVCGSDPFNNFINLKDLLIDFKPDYVFQMVSTTDLIADILIRGGFERFLENNKLKYKNSPWWEPIYAISNISRFFFNYFGYNEHLIKKQIDKNIYDELNETLQNLFEVYIEFCNINNIELFIFLRPDKQEIVKNEYDFNFDVFHEYISKKEGVHFFDLLPCFKSKIKERGTSIEKYFWIYDGHNNSKGYQLMAECILENTREQILN